MRSEQATCSEQPNVTTAPYSAGALSAATLNSSLRLFNAVRYVAGLDANVTLNDRYNELAQAAAVVNCVNGVLSHDPGQPSGMSNALYQLGSEGAGLSNIGFLWTGASSVEARLGERLIGGWMSDGAQNNIDTVGHRRWALNPSMGQIGFGAATRFGSYSKYGYGSESYMAMYAFDRSNSSAHQTNVAWPAQNMPISMFAANDPWSLSVGSRLDASSVTVKLTRHSDGKVWNFSSSSADGHFIVDNDGYGQVGCVIFRPDGVGGYQDGDSFDVRIEGAGSTAIEYTVNFFDETTPEQTVYDITTDCTFSAIPQQQWTGSQITPKPVVTNTVTGAVLREGVDYELSYGTNIEGSGTVTVKGIAPGYTGQRTLTFGISEKPAVEKKDPKLSIASTPRLVYGGGSAKLAVSTVSDGAVSFSTKDYGIVSLGSDGTVAPLTAGTANVTVSVAETAEYKASSVSVSVVVEKAKATLYIDDITITLGEDLPRYTYRVEGLVHEDDYLGTTAFWSNGDNRVGTFQINGTCTGNPNYEITVVPGTLTVLPAEPEKVTVSFDTRGGSSLKPLEVTAGEAPIIIFEPMRDGYYFDGWFLDAACTEPYVKGTPVYEDTTLYAKWKKTGMSDPQVIVDSNVEMAYGDEPRKLSVFTFSDGALAFESSDPSVVSVDENGVLTAVGAGQARVKVTVAACENYNEGSAIVEVTVAKEQATIRCASASKVQGEEDPTFTCAVEGLVHSGDLGTISYRREPGEEPGAYEIVPNYTPNPNYEVTVVPGTLTIVAPEPEPEPDPEPDPEPGPDPDPDPDPQPDPEPVSFLDSWQWEGGLYTWAAPFIARAADEGLIAGVEVPGGYEFQPASELTRGQVAVILYRATVSDPSDSRFPALYPDNGTDFEDNFDRQWYTAAVNWAARLGILQGSDGLVRPGDSVTRAELATMVGRWAEYAFGVDVESADKTALLATTDGAQLEAMNYGWAVPYLAWTADEGILGGVDNADGTVSINPKDTAQRAQMAKVVVVAMEAIGLL